MVSSCGVIDAAAEFCRHLDKISSTSIGLLYRDTCSSSSYTPCSYLPHQLRVRQPYDFVARSRTIKRAVRPLSAMTRASPGRVRGAGAQDPGLPATAAETARHRAAAPRAGHGAIGPRSRFPFPPAAQPSSPGASARALARPAQPRLGLALRVWLAASLLSWPVTKIAQPAE
jgi:hypothetical protein